MPAGFGYGAIGKAVRGALSSGASKSFLGSTVVGRGSGWRHAIGSDALRYTGMGLNKMAGMGTTQLAMTGGALAGGAYGAVADDTSVLGGMAMGAGLGYLGVRGARIGAAGIKSRSLSEAGRTAAGLFGSDYNRAINGIQSTLKAGKNIAGGLNVPNWMKM